MDAVAVVRKAVPVGCELYVQSGGRFDRVLECYSCLFCEWNSRIRCLSYLVFFISAIRMDNSSCRFRRLIIDHTESSFPSWMLLPEETIALAASSG